MTINVLIVVEDDISRTRLQQIVIDESALDLVGTVGTAAEGIRLAAEWSSVVVLVGTTLPDAPGLDAASEVCRQVAGASVVVVTDQADNDEFFTALRAGAKAYVADSIDAYQLNSVIQRVADGEWVINEQLLSQSSLASRVMRPADAAPPGASRRQGHGLFTPLTDAELVILAMVSEGTTNGEIAGLLGINSRAVKNHVTSILRKLAPSSRTIAVGWAHKYGWFIDDPADLTDLERAILRETPRTTAREEIARELGMTAEEITNHVRAAYRKRIRHGGEGDNHCGVSVTVRASDSSPSGFGPARTPYE